MSRDIEGTREDLTRNLDALSDKVSPSRLVERRVQRARGGLYRMRDKVMGTAHGVGESASGVGSSVSDAASSTADTVRDKAETVREKTEGNPLAAGLIAFGVGWLVSSLMPASQKETEIAGKLVDVAKEQGEPIAQEAAQVGREMGGTLKEKAAEAAQDVRSSAEDSAKHVADEARS